MTHTIKPFICLNDYEYMDNYSTGFHSHGAPKFNIKYIRVGYPIVDWTENTYKVFTAEDGQTEVTIGELLHRINDNVVAELNKGNNFAPHDAEDYCIERIDILDNMATVQFGS